MCGCDKELYKAIIEGTELQVCRECGKYGKILSKVVGELPAREKKESK